jgi:hypothetical protein
LFHPYFKEFQQPRTNFTNSVNTNSPVNVAGIILPKVKSPPKPKPVSPPKPKPVSPSPPKKTTYDCGKKAQPSTGFGAQKLTTQEMIDLLKSLGHPLPPSSKRDRQTLCDLIQSHGIVIKQSMINKLKVKSPVKPVPAPSPIPEVSKIKNFIASQNVIVEKPVPKPTEPPQLPEKKLWNLYTKKLTEQIYNTLPKEGEYQERMDIAGGQAYKRIKEMKARGEPAPAYTKK